MEVYAKLYHYLDEMDHVSQKRAARYFEIITYSFAVVVALTQITGFLAGMYTQKFKVTAWFVLVAMVLNLVLFLPGYPWYKKNSLNFLPPLDKKHN